MTYVLVTILLFYIVQGQQMMSKISNIISNYPDLGLELEKMISKRTLNTNLAESSIDFIRPKVILFDVSAKQPFKCDSRESSTQTKPLDKQN